MTFITFLHILQMPKFDTSRLVLNFSWIVGLARASAAFVILDEPVPATHKELGIFIYGLFRYRNHDALTVQTNPEFYSCERLPSKLEQRTTTRDSDLHSAQPVTRRYARSKSSQGIGAALIAYTWGVRKVPHVFIRTLLTFGTQEQCREYGWGV